jgi:hypothetical protein
MAHDPRLTTCAHVDGLCERLRLRLREIVMAGGSFIVSPALDGTGVMDNAALALSAYDAGHRPLSLFRLVCLPFPPDAVGPDAVGPDAPSLE